MDKKVSIKAEAKGQRPWRVTVGSVSASFRTEQEATTYASTLEQRLAPGLPAFQPKGGTLR
ncbi:hypothetical protein [Pseudomonas sp. NPDC007930]|uniref:hypothetical protein n=1 Tax=Pseudomonas sp. NPDC007930 TaxID=3364417 RepID=UPI0036E16843